MPNGFSEVKSSKREAAVLPGSYSLRHRGQKGEKVKRSLARSLLPCHLDPKSCIDSRHPHFKCVFWQNGEYNELEQRFKTFRDHPVGTCLIVGCCTSPTRVTEGPAHRDVGLRFLQCKITGWKSAVGLKSQGPLYTHKQRSLFLASLSLRSSKIRKSPQCYGGRIQSYYAGKPRLFRYLLGQRGGQIHRL